MTMFQFPMWYYRVGSDTCNDASQFITGSLAEFSFFMLINYPEIIFLKKYTV